MEAIATTIRGRGLSPSRLVAIADRLEKGILGLNNLVLIYAISQDPSDWDNFTTASTELGKWFNDQQPMLASAAERPFLDRINIAYSDYLAAAAGIHEKIYPSRQSVTRLKEFTALY